MTDTTPQPAESAHTAGLRKALALGAVALVVLMMLSAGLWAALDGTPGLWGALLGAAIGGVFVLLTAVVVVATARTSPTVTGAVLLGTWLLKLIVAIGLVAALKPLDFYSKRAFALTIVVAMVVVLATETVAIIRHPAPSVEPVPGA
ncbi:hypothetical protein [Rhodococcus sp. IEGM 1408]|uniref:hypothetical protein n=1 Tax=Rhodococcus sp. IEGM 1408 TaxID=3082220 RepID=UPI002955A97B|nr:hypothetical protein [Rhodococcus sp. IEGM 1408]MDV8000554.1 hypothetical protein [Rhodococcus sp. IEGM 1408]